MEDTIKLPLDADGVPIRPGDVVYNLKIKEPNPQKVRALRYSGTQVRPWSIEVTGETIPYVPDCFSHIKPDTLEDIEKAINELMDEATIKYLIKEEIKERVDPLMERIKRMVER